MFNEQFARDKPILYYIDVDNSCETKYFKVMTVSFWEVGAMVHTHKYSKKDQTGLLPRLSRK